MGKADDTSRQHELYAEAVATFGPALARLARAYVSDPDARQDLLQEIHVALWRSLARFEGRCSLRTWIYRVAHNTATARVVRVQSRLPTIVALDDSLDSLVATVNDEQVFDRRRALQRLHDLIRRLRPLDRQVMLLYLEQENAVSISDITGLSPANVATKISRIKQLLVRQFHAGVGHDQ